MPGSSLSREERDAMRPTECPNHGTMRICGKAYKSGCRTGPCVEGKKQERKGVPAEKRQVKVKAATPRRVGPKTEQIELYLQRMEVENRRREKGTREGNWVWHTEECCRRVWRPVSWPCVEVAARPVG